MSRSDLTPEARCLAMVMLFSLAEIILFVTLAVVLL